MRQRRSFSPVDSTVGIVLVHGYRGRPADLATLETALASRYGTEAVTNVCLPAHGTADSPPFDEAAFLAGLSAAIETQRNAGRQLVLLGHSTGGTLLLAEIARRLASDPSSLETLRLLVLCATPPVIDLGYAQRWAEHATGQETLLHDVGALVSLINRLARRGSITVPASVLVLHGEDDELVPVSATDLWRKGRLNGPVRQLRISDAKHHLFTGENAGIAIDAVCRAVDDAVRRQEAEFTADQSSLFEMMPGLEIFLSSWPHSASHIDASPAAYRARGEKISTCVMAEAEPTIANIEITTRCNLGCPACARTQLKVKSRFMPRDDFARVLEHLPHAYRIVLVGLGEPLMHPEVVDFIKLAVAARRRVGLVTNGTLLDADLAEALCRSGLAAITFSLDAIDQAIADRVRTGSDMARISENIRMFSATSRRLGAAISTSAFTALTEETVGEFGAIVDFAADHELDALMVSDLNFPSNQARTLHRALSQEQRTTLRQGLKRAVARRLPVLSVHGLEEFALDRQYLDYLLLRGEEIAARATRHTRCLSPWQSIPVNVDGKLTVCDCQPEAVIGNIHRDGVSAWWNGPAMTEHRRRMLSDDPPEACLACPRF